MRKISTKGWCAVPLVRKTVIPKLQCRYQNVRVPGKMRLIHKRQQNQKERSRDEPELADNKLEGARPPPANQRNDGQGDKHHCEAIRDCHRSVP